MDAPRTPITPINNLINVLTGFSADHEKALKRGIYNALGLCLLCLVGAAGYGLYLILHPFVKPLIWALLCGSVLFPLKLYITNTVQAWFTETENSHEPLLVNLAVVPLRIMDRISEGVGSFLHEKFNKYVGITLASIAAVLFIYWYTPSILTCLAWRMIHLGSAIVSIVVTNCNIYMIFVVAVGYVSVLILYWTPENAIPFNYASLGVWLIFSLYVSNILGAYQVLVFCTLQILCIVGLAFEVIMIMDKKETEGKPLTFGEAIQCALVGNEMEKLDPSASEDDEQQDTFVEEIRKPRISTEEIKDLLVGNTSKTPLKLTKKGRSLDADVGQSAILKARKKSGRSNISNSGTNVRHQYIFRKLRTELSIDISDDNVDTSNYMYGAVYACTGMLLWKHKWILTILILPIFWYVLKRMGRYFGFWDVIQGRISFLICLFKAWYRQRQEALVPAHIRGLYKVYIIIDKKMRDVLKSSVDSVATIIVILALIIFVFCSSIFIVIQIYAEGMHLVQVTGEILNSTLMNNPDIDWLPQQWEDSVNSVLDNAYTYGRSAISDGIKGLVKDMESSKAEIVEKKVLELWDRLYQAWMMSDESPNMIGPTVDVAAAMTVWESLKESFVKMPNQMFNIAGIQNFAKEHLGILLSVLDSVWGIIKGNMSVVMSIFTELLYVVLMSGTALLNFTLSMVVFFTTLFYLLSSSGKTYKPIELIAVFSPISCYSMDNFGGFALALQQAVIGVFAATFKLASFFGMWTWFIHNLFQVKIVYLPSAFASVLAAVPFLDAYFACIPATIELWYTRGPMIAMLFFTFHFLPCNIVITDFYKEIKSGGHPYLTGLSIAGGIFCLGVEGAIFGPLLLCCIMVVINLSRKYMQSVSVDTFHSLKSQINQIEGDQPSSTSSI